MNLVIVESPTKAKTISKFLGKGYNVEPSYGHIRDLPKSSLGIDVEHNFEPQYVIPKKVTKTVNNLKKVAQKADRVILATDEDREGEAIAWHLRYALGLVPEKTERIVFHEITKSAIENALKNPRDIDANLVNAQQARRVLDRLVGYKLSPFLWKKVQRGLSAGRVQSATVRLIVERENEIRGFKPRQYWTIAAGFSGAGKNFEATLGEVNGKELEKFDIVDEDAAKSLVVALKNLDYSVAKIEKSEFKKHPLPPFITSTLQQAAVHRFGYSSRKTMFLAQRLYEQGQITYMRTDSVNLSRDALSAAKEWLVKELGGPYAETAPRVYTSKSRLAQEAHEAIRPTDVFMLPEGLSVKEEAERKLYRLIWQRFLASQMPPAKVLTTTAEIADPDNKYVFRATGQKIIFDGFLKMWPQKFTEREVPELERGEKLQIGEIIPAQHFTEPSARYSEATLIKALEENGIGRPSTYAPTITTIQTRDYVKKEKGRFYPTPTGELVNKVLTENFPDVVDIGFTAKMEEGLDNVAEGKEKWQELIALFYSPFAKQLEEKYASVEKQKVSFSEPTDQICEKCGKPMVIKMGRFGKFMACSGFPDCKNVKSLPKEPPKPIGMKCSKCGEGEIVERRAAKGRSRGKTFWGCNKYPQCDYASWIDPRSAEGSGEASSSNPQLEQKIEEKSEDKVEEKTD